MVRFGHVSVTLRNGWGDKKCVGNYCAFSMAISLDIKTASIELVYFLILVCQLKPF